MHSRFDDDTANKYHSDNALKNNFHCARMIKLVCEKHYFITEEKLLKD